MTGKRQSKDNVSRARRSAPDLGQKEAKLEKTSAEELRHMEGGDVAKSPRQQLRSSAKVQVAMHKGVEWAGPDTPVIELAKLMRKHDIGAIPIGENDQLIGMVTDRDIVVRALADGKDIQNVKITQVMTKQVRTVNEDASVREVIDVMSRAQVRRVPVVNRNNELVGIVSMKDLATDTKDDSKVGQAVEEISKGPSNN